MKQTPPTSGKRRSKPPTPRTYPVIFVSRTTYELIQDLEAAWCRFSATKDRTEIEDAYSALNQRRKELYQHLAKIEGEQRIVDNTVVLRFD
jgi:hypothetical protein